MIKNQQQVGGGLGNKNKRANQKQKQTSEVSTCFYLLINSCKKIKSFLNVHIGRDLTVRTVKTRSPGPSAGYLSFQTSACVNSSLFFFSSNQDHFFPPMTQVLIL